MTQEERLLFLIQYLIDENTGYRGLPVPGDSIERKRLLRSLMNVRPPRPISKEFLEVQGDYLTEEKNKRPLVSPGDLQPVCEDIYLWQGDITTLKVDAIVNAANSSLLGCFIPCHGCIDNAIHSAAGVELRLACTRIMERQGREEPVGSAKITKGYHLPCRYVLHTVGPIICGSPTQQDCALLASCYRSCLELAAAYGLCSIAFCCISTGEFHFPGERAAQIAVQTVQEFRQQTKSNIEVIFNVFTDADYAIYQRLLQAGGTAGGMHRPI